MYSEVWRIGWSIFILPADEHMEMILRNTNIPQYWRTHSPRHKWLDLLGITTSNWTSPPAPLFHLFFASLPNSLYEAYDCEWIRLIIFLGSGFHWWWIFLVGGRLCIWICQICIFCIPYLSSEWIGLQFAHWWSNTQKNEFQKDLTFLFANVSTRKRRLRAHKETAPPLSSRGVPTPSTATNYKDLPTQQYLNFMFEDICTNNRDPVNICTIFSNICT